MGDVGALVAADVVAEALSIRRARVARGVVRSLSRCHVIHVVVQVEQAVTEDVHTVRVVRYIRHRAALNVVEKELFGDDRAGIFNGHVSQMNGKDENGGEMKRYSLHIGIDRYDDMQIKDLPYCAVVR